MSLRFIYGRAGSGKSYFCLNAIKARINEGGESPLVLLIPEQFSLQAERNLIKAIGTGSFIKTDVLSFGRLAYRVFSEVGGITYPHINSASKCMIIHKILEGMKERFKIFSKASNQQGFINTLADLITEFKRYNVTPDSLEENLSRIKGNEVLKGKLAELNSIYKEYEKTIQEKYRDSDDDLKLLAEKLDKSSQFDGAEIWIDEFSGFTPLEYEVIAKLLEKAARINISLCTDCLVDESETDNVDVFSPVKAEVYKLLRIAKDKDINIEAPIILKEAPLYRFRNSEEIIHLEKYLYTFPYSKYTPETKDIKIFSAVNIYSEIENTAREIISLCRDRGFRYKDIAVVSGNLGAYEKFIGAVFTSFNIPFFIDKKIEIIRHPIIQLITSMFEIFSSNWSYEAVFSYLKTGLTGIDIEEIDLIENYVLACGIRGNRWTQEEGWNYKTQLSIEESENNENDNNLYLTINKIRQDITNPLTAFRAKTKGRKTSREICEALYDFLCCLGIPEKIELTIAEFRRTGQLTLANEYGQVWNIVMEVFNQIAEVIGQDTIGIERFSDLLKIGFGEYKIGLIPPSLDQVLVGNVERSKNHEVKAVYVLGVNDGLFPCASPSEGILTDKDRENLKTIGVEIAKGTRTKVFEEQYLIYTTLTTASSFLRLSYPIADHEGKTMRPSIVISRLKKLFPGILEYSNIISTADDAENIEFITSQVPTFNELVGNMRRNYEGSEMKPLWWDVYGWYKSKDAWQRKCETAKFALEFTNQVKTIGKEKVKKLYGDSIYSSVSRFEKYVSCPFSYYIQYGLKAKERRIYKLNPPDIGTFMHAVIERFSKLVSEGEESWRQITLAWCTETISNIVDEMLEKMQGSIMNGSVRYINLSKRLKRVLVRAAWLIAEHIKRSSFEPIGYEVGFGDREEFPAIILELPTGVKISLTGRIDRVDAFKTEEGTYLRIIDYKSGTKAFKLSDVFYGMQIQLITYLDAIGENGQKDLPKPILPGGMLYFKIDDPIIKSSNKISEEDVEKAIIKQLKMKGLLLADVKLIKEMDSQIDGNSIIIPARINKGDVLGKSSAATLEQFEVLRKYVRSLLTSIGEEMLKGDIPIKPFKNKRTTPCTYCDYSSVCQFDPTLKDNKYRIMNDKNDEEVWEAMRQNGGK